MLLIFFIALVFGALVSGYRWPRGIQRSRSVLHAKAVYKVTVVHNNKETTIDVREDCSILSAALDAGIDLPHDCDLGVCLTCPSRIVSGKVDQTGNMSTLSFTDSLITDPCMIFTGGTLDDSVQEQGFALTCCSYPRSDVVVRSIDEDELVSAQFKRE